MLSRLIEGAFKGASLCSEGEGFVVECQRVLAMPIPATKRVEIAKDRAANRGSDCAEFI